MNEERVVFTFSGREIKPDGPIDRAETVGKAKMHQAVQSWLAKRHRETPDGLLAEFMDALNFDHPVWQ